LWRLLAPQRGDSGWGPSLGLAIRATPPIGNLGLVDLVTHIVGRSEARGRAGGALDVDDTPTVAADQMVVVIADAILESSRRACRLDPPEEPSIYQNTERVVYRLERDGSNLVPDDVRYFVSRHVRAARYRPQHSQTLSGNLNAALTKKR
jgi:hypothetical protein